MAKNIEVKAVMRDPARVRAVTAARATRGPEVETQVDTYYRVDASGEARLKVRDSSRHGLQRIRYHRPEVAGVRASEYELTPLTGPDDPRLADLGEPVLVVTKRREVFWVDNVRVHLDRVEGLGEYLELEAVVDATHDDARGFAQVEELLAAFGVGEADRVRASYSDLLAAKRGDAGGGPARPDGPRGT